MKRRLIVSMSILALSTWNVACGEDDDSTPDGTAETEVQQETTEPETEVAQPETEVAQPETEVAQPETEVAQPETEVAQPETEVAQPETEVTQPETEVSDEVVEETSPEVSEETTGPVTWDAVYPIFASSCTPCHGGNTPTGGSGGHAIASADKATAYAASQLNADVCPGKTIGECALVRIQNGSMPASGDCQNPIGPKCPDAAEQALIQQWIDDGMLE